MAQVLRRDEHHQKPTGFFTQQNHQIWLIMSLWHSNQTVKSVLYNLVLWIHFFPWNPNDLLFLKLFSPQNKAKTPIKTRGPIWVPGIYMYTYIVFLVAKGFLVSNKQKTGALLNFPLELPWFRYDTLPAGMWTSRELHGGRWFLFAEMVNKKTIPEFGSMGRTKIIFTWSMNGSFLSAAISCRNQDAFKIFDQPAFRSSKWVFLNLFGDYPPWNWQQVRPWKWLEDDCSFWGPAVIFAGEHRPKPLMYCLGLGRSYHQCA